jgi:hypothetical protein
VAVPLTEEEDGVSSPETEQQIAASVTSANKVFDTLILSRELEKRCVDNCVFSSAINFLRAYIVRLGISKLANQLREIHGNFCETN